MVFPPHHQLREIRAVSWALNGNCNPTLCWEAQKERTSFAAKDGAPSCVVRDRTGGAWVGHPARFAVASFKMETIKIEKIARPFIEVSPEPVPQRLKPISSVALSQA